MPDRRDSLPVRPRSPATAPSKLEWPVEDPLEHVLSRLRTSRPVLCRTSLGAGTGVLLPSFPGTVMVHVVTAGTVAVEVAGTSTMTLHGGGVAVMPRGVEHRLVSRPGASVVALLEAPRRVEAPGLEHLTLGAPPAVAEVLCVTARLDRPAAGDLLAHLPVALHQRVTDSDVATWQAAAVAFADDMRAGRPAPGASLARVVDGCVVGAVRAWADHAPSATWIAALRDPHIGRALTALHARLDQDWTLASLAREAGMSRSAFAARFVAVVGTPVMQHVTAWRMRVAHGLLADAELTLADVADRVGYASEAAFSRAFKRVHGCSPGEVRRRAAASPVD